MYAPGSTTVNELSLLDFAGTSPLLAPNGLTLGDVGSGAEVIVQLQHDRQHAAARRERRSKRART